MGYISYRLFLHKGEVVYGKYPTPPLLCPRERRPRSWVGPTVSSECRNAGQRFNQSNAQALTIPNCSPCYYFYGSNHSWMLKATNDWYQHQGNWCGIANIRAIQVYDWLYYNGGPPKWDNSQEAIHDRLNSYLSPWGHGPGGYVLSDIAADGGTDRTPLLMEPGMIRR